MVQRRLWKQWVRQFADRAGYHLVPKWQSGTFVRALETEWLFRRFDITCVIDVGANEGQFYSLVRHEIGFTGPIASIEPLPDLALQLRTTAAKTKDRNWTVIECALGDEEGTRPFNRMASTLFSSFLSPATQTADQFGELNRVVSVIPVTVRRLDNLISDIGSKVDTSRCFLKLDTQGFDLNVMRGIGAAGERIAVVQTEASIRPLYEGMPSLQESLRFLDEHGFDPASILAVGHDARSRLIEVDIVAVNRALTTPRQP